MVSDAAAAWSARSVAQPVSGPAARAAARHELSRPEYHRSGPGPVTRAVHWLLDRLDHLFTGGPTSHALLIVVVVLVAVLIVLAARLAPARGSRSARGGSGGPDLLAPLAARDHRRLAAQFAAEGRNAEALREWLRAAVATIEERGVLPPRPGRTGAAIAREAGPLLPAAAGDLTAAMAAFDEVWFGGRTALPQDVARAAAAADAVQSARIVSEATSREPQLAVPR